MRGRWCLTLVLSAVAAAVASAQPQFSDAVRGFIRIDAPVIALTNVRVIDGTGAPARANQTIVIASGDHRGGRRRGARDVRRRGDGPRSRRRSVMPGLVMVHEHLYYPTGPGVYGQLGESFIRLYLAGGVTTMRTGGNMNGFMDLNLKQLIEHGQRAGPAIDATAPYLNGPNTFMQMRDVERRRTTRAGRSRTGRTRARRRSRPTCRSRAPSSARRSRKRTSAA